MFRLFVSVSEVEITILSLLYIYMKIWFVALAALIVLSFGCMRSIASEEDTIDVKALHGRTLGASARELLSAETYTSLKIEIQYMAGFAPDKDALYYLQNFLEQRLHKPRGIHIVLREIAPVADTVLTIRDAVEIERKNRTAFTNGKQLAVYFLYTNGLYTNDKIFGMAYRNTSAVIFGKNIHNYSGTIGKPGRTKLEATVLLHEMGHLLGLAGKGTPMLTNHLDENHVSHCKNRKCLMYYGVGTEDKFGYLIKGNIPDLDEDCLADLNANGGK